MHILYLQVMGDRLEMYVDNDILGDPAPGKPKQLVVTYMQNKKVGRRRYSLYESQIYSTRVR
jgi:hypothetical protein